MNIIQGIEAGVLLATTYAVELSQIGTPTPPFKIGHEWFVVEQVPPPSTTAESRAKVHDAFHPHG